jgi:hypothetical protein
MILRSSIFRLLFLAAALPAMAAMDQPSQPIVLSPDQAVKEGRALVDEMLAARPAENKTTTGKMTIRGKKKFTQIPVTFTIQVSPTNWLSGYTATVSNFTVDVVQIAILHTSDQPNLYYQKSYTAGSNGVALTTPTLSPIKDEGILAPFAGSDFALCDLGLEFLHWPEQRLVQKEMKRSRSCRVLESVNPRPVNGGYSKVKSWVDAESDGIVYALAYDVNGKQLKEFIPKDFSKVNGQWQLEEMQISNLQTDSSTTVKFNLDR